MSGRRQGGPGIRRGPRSGGGRRAFDPADVGSLTLRLDGDQVTASGGNVTDWPDQSGNGNDADTPGNAPAQVTDALNGHDVVRFDNNNSEHMRILHDATLSMTADGFTLYTVVLSTGAGGGTNDLFSKWDATPGREWLVRLEDGSSGEGDVLVRNGADNANYNAGTAELDDSSWHVARVRFDGTGEVGLRRDSDSEVTDSSQTGFNTGTADVYIASRDGSSNFTSVDMAYALLYQQEVSAADDTKIMSWLNSRFGL